MKEEVEVYKTKLALKLHFKNTGCLNVGQSTSNTLHSSPSDEQRAQCPAILNGIGFKQKSSQLPVRIPDTVMAVLPNCHCRVRMDRQQKSLAHS
jgi:hypothetical protein